MLMFPSNVTSNDILQLVEDVVASRTYSKASACGCQLFVEVDEETSEPVITVDTGDKYLTITVNTEEVEQNGQPAGWVFNPVTSISEYTEDYADDAAAKLRNWGQVAELILAIEELEIYPMDYFE